MQSRAFETAAVPEGGRALPPVMAWGAVLAGTVVAVAIGLTLNILGAAVGASVVDLVARDTPDAGSAGIAGGLWLLVANLIGLGFGGYVAARLSGTADGTDSVLHGLSVWALGVLAAAILSGHLLAGAAGTATHGAAAALGGVAQGAGQAVSAISGQVAQTAADPRAAVERAQAALRTGGDPAAMTGEQRNAEMARLFTRRIASGTLSAEDRHRLTALAATEYQLPAEEVERRLQRVEAEITEGLRQAEQAAREAGDKAAEAAAAAAYWAFAALLLGAVAAVLGARLGTRAWVIARGRLRPMRVPAV